MKSIMKTRNTRVRATNKKKINSNPSISHNKITKTVKSHILFTLTF